MSESVFAVVVTHRRPDELAKSLDVVSTQTRLPDHLIVVDNDGFRDRATTACAIWLPANRSPPPTWDRAETWAARAVSRWACCTRWPRAPTGCGWPTTTDARRTARCWRPCWPAPRSTGWPRCRRWCAIWTTRSGWRFRCGEAWYGAGAQTNCVPKPGRICCAGSRRCSTAPCSGRPRWNRSAFRTCGCSSAATKWRCTAGWCGPACRSAPAWTRCTCIPADPTSSSRSWAAGCTPNIPTTRPSDSSPTATAATCCRSRACASCCPRSGCGSAGSSW